MILIARHALRESLRRRIFAVVIGLSIAFGALYAFGTHELFKDVSGFGGDESGRFVNGILDRIRGELDRPAREASNPPK